MRHITAKECWGQPAVTFQRVQQVVTWACKGLLRFGAQCLARCTYYTTAKRCCRQRALTVQGAEQVDAPGIYRV